MVLGEKVKPPIKLPDFKMNVSFKSQSRNKKNTTNKLAVCGRPERYIV